jgi:predicted HTH domain antitoxin
MALGRDTMTTVTIALPDDLLATLHRSPLEMEAEVRLAAAVDWYRRGLLSQGHAAEIAGMPRADFIDALSARRIEVAQVEADELAGELGG